jgi:hypothetical protein
MTWYDTQNWQAVADVHLESYRREARTAESLRRKFQEISCRTGSLAMARLTVLAEIALVLTSHMPGTSLAAVCCSDSCSCTAWFVHPVPLFPALCAYWLFADWTSYSRCSACLPPLICTQFSSELLSVTHPAITPRYHPKTHPHVGTLICRHTCSKFVLHRYFCFLRRWMRNTYGDSIQTKKTFVAIAWDEMVLSHKVWPFV